ncbi:DUF502 domain-containing protein [Candidatus Nitrospira nitrificans]|jgi:uncharacterized membrane protein|uniref:DUF502 domain-containing protein n=1 Tax=Candidatus Nitrospira nitrificans TaxID=1742973 RepID=A0A0S4LFC7_9BACT|nr:DUF502 domain-containing protein [Candidatus Nitrospira nitrificans]CUS36300.1 conserved hypothetical protein [Candidatus Nitrospira nitrificans]
MIKAFSKTCMAGLIILVPAWTTFLILTTLFTTLDSLIGRYMLDPLPGLGLFLLVLLLILAGIIGEHMVGRDWLAKLEHRIEQIPLIQSIYLTLKGMTDVLNFRSRFGRSKVVAFPFPRDGCWALGFVMGTAPPSVQVEPSHTLFMVFVPTAIHPFTGFLAFIPEHALRSINLPVEDAMKMEFSAGFYRPPNGWLDASPSRST